MFVWYSVEPDDFELFFSLRRRASKRTDFVVNIDDPTIGEDAPEEPAPPAQVFHPSLTDHIPENRLLSMLYKLCH